MRTTLQPKILLVTLKYDFKAMQRENSPNEVQKWYPRGTNFFRVQTVQMGYGWQPCRNVKMYFSNFLQREEKRVTSMMIQWSSGASKKKKLRNNSNTKS